LDHIVASAMSFVDAPLSMSRRLLAPYGTRNATTLTISRGASLHFDPLATEALRRGLGFLPRSVEELERGRPDRSCPTAATFGELG
jgi:hypothetical protein